jgi:hypothetical protein
MEHNSAPLFPVLAKLIQSMIFQPICLCFALRVYFRIHLANAIKGKSLRVQTYRVLDVPTVSFPFKLNTLRRMVKNVVTNGGIEVGIECEYVKCCEV